MCLKIWKDSCNFCRTAYLCFSRIGNVPCTWWCIWKYFFRQCVFGKMSPFLFPPWKVWFSLHSSCGCNLLSQISKTALNYCHFCQEAGASSVPLFHVSMFCKILTHTALRIWKSSCCSGVSFGKWHGWSLTEMKYSFYSKCQSCSIFLKENMMLKLAARWDLGELLEESSFGYEINAKWDVHWWERGM